MNNSEKYLEERFLRVGEAEESWGTSFHKMHFGAESAVCVVRGFPE